jgi:hypothetical protein
LSKEITKEPYAGSTQKVRCKAFECGKIIKDNVVVKVNHFQKFHPIWWGQIIESSKSKDPYTRTHLDYFIKTGNVFEEVSKN